MKGGPNKGPSMGLRGGLGEWLNGGKGLAGKPGGGGEVEDCRRVY